VPFVELSTLGLAGNGRDGAARAGGALTERAPVVGGRVLAADGNDEDVVAERREPDEDAVVGRVFMLENAVVGRALVDTSEPDTGRVEAAEFGSETLMPGVSCTSFDTKLVWKPLVALDLFAITPTPLASIAVIARKCITWSSV